MLLTPKKAGGARPGPVKMCRPCLVNQLAQWERWWTVKALPGFTGEVKSIVGDVAAWCAGSEEKTLEAIAL